MKPDYVWLDLKAYDVLHCFKRNEYVSLCAQASIPSDAMRIGDYLALFNEQASWTRDRCLDCKKTFDGGSYKREAP